MPGRKMVIRSEHKYLLSAEHAVALAARLGSLLTADRHNGRWGYRMRSLYFDTPEHRDYLEKEAGVPQRSKYRLRIYDAAAETAYLEHKQKDGERQQKLSFPVSRGQAQGMVAGGPPPLLQDGADAARLYTQMQGRRPTLLIEYSRAAYIWPVRNTRITLDSDIGFTAVGLDLFQPRPAYQPLSLTGEVVLEVKYDGCLEPFIREIIQPYCQSRLSFGKYERCLWHTL